jgi:UDP-4-amino-4,6-dideoxy-N-acetyl-beta-L-altrosamine N-acetyltransferase
MPVELRELDSSDSEIIHQWRNLEDVRKWMYTDHIISRDEHEAWFQRIQASNSDRYWMIVFNGSDVGVANISQIDTRHSRCTWAFYLAEPSTRGMGVGAATEFLVLEHVFGIEAINRLWCEVIESNSGVVALHERFGFRREGLLRSHIFKEGQKRNVVLLALLRSEWNAVREHFKSDLAAKGLIK